MKRLFLLMTLVASACSTAVTPDNPYDPQGTGPKMPGRIKGIVYVQGAASQEGIAVTIFDAAGARVDGDGVRSDAEGRFISPELVPATYSLALEVPVGNVPVLRNDILVSPAQETDVGLLTSLIEPPTGRISGSVTIDGDVSPPSDVRVVLSRVSNGVTESRVTVTDNDGVYAFESLIDGAYEIRADKQGFTPDLLTTALTKMNKDNQTELPPMKLYPASAVVRFSVTTAAGQMLGAPYTRAREVGLVMLAFGGVNEMRFGVTADFSDAGSELAWRDYLAEVPVMLTDGEGTKEIYAQFRVMDAPAARERLRTEVYRASIVFDRSPPQATSFLLAPEARSLDGQRYFMGDLNAVPVSLTAIDPYSKIAGVKLLVGDQNSDQVAYHLIGAPDINLVYTDVVPLPGGDGKKQVGLQLMDGAGNVSPVVYSFITVDHTPPKLLTNPAVTIRGASGSELRSQFVTLQFFVGGDAASDVDGPARMRYGTAPVSPIGQTIPFLPEVNLVIQTQHDQTVQFYGVFEDQAGNAVTALSPVYRMNLRGGVSGFVYLEGIPENTDILDGSKVQVYPAGAALEPVNMLREAETATNGSYLVDNLPAGTYQVRFARDGAIAQVQSPVVVSPGAITDLSSVRLVLARGDVKAVFHYADLGVSANHSGILVRAILGNRVLGTTVTDATGTALLSGLPIGDTYTLKGTADGYLEAQKLGVQIRRDQLTLVDSGAPLLLAKLSGDFKICDEHDSASKPKECSAILYTNEQRVLLGLDVDVAINRVRYILQNPAKPGVASFTDPTALPNDDPCPAPPAADCWNPYDGDSHYLVATDTYGEGRTTIVVQFAKDNSPQSPGSSQVVYDITPPFDSAVYIQRGTTALVEGYTNDNELTLELSAVATLTPGIDAAPISSVRVSRDSTWNGTGVLGDLEFTYGGNQLFTVASGDGVKTVYAWFVDEAGNTDATPITADIVLDTLAPSLSHGVSITPTGPGISVKNLPSRQWWTRSASYAIALDLGASPLIVSEPDVAAFRLSFAATFANSEWRPVGFDLYAANDTITDTGLDLLPVDGDYILWVQYADAAGNVSTEITEHQFALELDTVPPGGTVNLESGAPYTKKTSNLAVTLTTDPTNGALFMQTTWTGIFPDPYKGARQAFSSSFNATPPVGEGERVFYVRLFDAAGNFTERSDGIIVDTTPPTQTSVSINNGAAFTKNIDGMVTLYLTAADVISGVKDMRLAYNRSMTGSTALPYSPILNYTVDATTVDGPKTIYVKFADNAGNETADAVSDTIILDKTGPAISTMAINANATYTSSHAVQLTITASDTYSGVVGMALADGFALGCATANYESYQASRAWTLPVGGGEKWVSVCVRDGAGNDSFLNDSIIVDATPPNSVSLSIAGGSVYTNTGANLALTIVGHDDVTADNQLQYQLSEDPTFASITTWTSFPGSGMPAGVKWTFAGTGEKVLYLRIRDLAGNLTTTSDSIIIDASGPTAASIALSPTDYTISQTVTANLSVADGASMCLWGDMSNGSNDSCVANGWKPYAATSPVNLSAVNSEKTIWVKFKDAAGNTSSNASDSVTWDNQGPSTTTAMVTLYGWVKDGASSPTLTATPTVDVTLKNFIEATTSITMMMLSEDPNFYGAVWQPYATAFRWTLSAGDGPKTLRVKVLDIAGNESLVKTASITVDTTPPTSPFILVKNGDPYTLSATSNSLTLGVTNADGGTDMKFSINGTTYGAWIPFSTPYTFTTNLGSDGLKTVYVLFRDAAGNESSVASDSITLDTSVPAVTSFSINSGANYTSSEIVTLNSNVTGADQMCVSTSGATCTGTWIPYATLVNGLLTTGDCATPLCKTVYLCYRDFATNAPVNCSSDTITLDTTPPSAPLITTPPQVLNANSITVLISAPVTETFFARYEMQSSPSQSSFSEASTDRLSTSFIAPLRQESQPGVRGENTIHIRAVDRAGNVSLESILQIIEDSTPPQTPVLAGTMPIPTVNAQTYVVYFDQNLNRSREDWNFDHYEIRGGALGATWTPTPQYDGLVFSLIQGDGVSCGTAVPCRNDLQIRAVDKAGNVNGSALFTVFEDSTVPTTPRIWPRDGIVNAAAVDLRLTTGAYDASGPVVYQVQGGQYAEFSDTGEADYFTFMLAEDQENILCVRARDAAGNVSAEDCATVAERSTELITQTFDDEMNPDIYGDWVVYEKLSSWPIYTEVYLRNLSDGWDWMLSDWNPPTGPATQPRVTATYDTLMVTYVEDGTIKVYQQPFDGSASSYSNASAVPNPSDPDISGSKLIYVSTAAGVRDLYYFNIDTSTTVKVTEGGQVCPGSKPRINWPDIMWCEVRGTPAIYVMNLSVALGYSRPAQGYAQVYGEHINVGTVGNSVAIADDYMAWIEDGKLVYSYDGEGQGLSRTVTAITVAEVNDLWKDMIVVTTGSDGYNYDIAAYDIYPTPTLRRIVTDPEPQVNPAMSFGRVVWQDERDINKEIYAYDFATTRWVIAHPASQSNPVLVGNRLAWNDARSSAGGVGYFDLVTGVETMVSGLAGHLTDLGGSTGSYLALLVNGKPTVYDTTLFGATLLQNDTASAGVAVSREWPYRSAWSVTATGLWTDNLPAVPSPTLAAAGADPFFDPDIEGDNLVWTTTNGRVMAKNLSSGLDAAVFSDPGKPVNHARLAGSNTNRQILVWEASGDIYRCLLDGTATPPACSSTIPIAAGSSTQRKPEVDPAGYIVWEGDQRSTGYFDIFIYMLYSSDDIFATRNITRLTPYASNQTNPRVWNGRVVWEERAFGNSDIWMFELP